MTLMVQGKQICLSLAKVWLKKFNNQGAPVSQTGDPVVAAAPVYHTRSNMSLKA